MSDFLPPGWSKRRVSDIADLQLGKMLDKAKNIVGTPFSYLRNINVRWGNIQTDDLYSMNFTSTEADRFSIRDGDVLVCEGGEPGRCAVWRGGPTDLKFQKAIHRIRPCTNVLPDWIALFLRHEALQKSLADHFSGTTIKHLPAQALAALHLPVPALAEQRRILARIEALFARTRRARADLERIAPLASRYEQAVRDEVLQAGQDAGWPERTLGEVTSEVRNGIAAKPFDEPPGMRILRISAVRQGRVMLADNRYHRPAANANTRPYLLRNRDLLFIRFNGNSQLVAACGMVRDLEGECVYPDKLIRIRTDQRCAVPEYIEITAGSSVAREQLVNHIKTAAGQHGISGADLKTLKLPMPDVTIQATVASEVTKKRNAGLVAQQEAARALALLDRLEQSILIRAFRGELVSQAASASDGGPDTTSLLRRISRVAATSTPSGCPLLRS